jgi:hypothetical protein
MTLTGSSLKQFILPTVIEWDSFSSCTDFLFDVNFKNVFLDYSSFAIKNA